MVYYLIMCRSLTYAQKLSHALEQGGVSAQILRSPTSISPSRCSYSVKVSGHNLSRALIIINRLQLPHLGIFVGSSQDGYREVEP